MPSEFPRALSLWAISLATVAVKARCARYAWTIYFPADHARGVIENLHVPFG
jgi:hypothetical protein